MNTRLYNDPKILALLEAMRTQSDKQAIDAFADFFGQHLAGTTYGQLLKSQQDAEEQARWAKHYCDEADKLRTKVERQAKRIRVLEGPTNHAGGLKANTKAQPAAQTP
jgi:hypothetical protein